MSDLYNLEECVAKYKGLPASNAVVPPTLVDAETLVNVLNLDSVFGLELVKSAFAPVSMDEPEDIPVELVALAAVEAAAVNLPEKESNAILDAVASARKSLGFDKVEATESLVFEGEQEKPVVEEAPAPVKGKK